MNPTPLESLIRERIRREGPLSFRDFMEMALYYPGLGYYTAGLKRVGMEDADFFTSATISPLFGRLIAKQIREMWQFAGTGAFTIVEYGAGTGALARAVIGYFREHHPTMPDYVVIERNPQARQALEGAGVRFVGELEEIGPFTGCVLSNELLDNFPVHRVVMQRGLMEVLVGYDGGFVETLRPASPELVSYFTDLGVTLPEGYAAEVNLDAAGWLAKIARHQEKGFVLTIDYGYLAGEMYSAARKAGTLICYHRHTVNDRPYADIGGQDITSHVNFSALALFAMREGFQLSGFRDQGPFLRALGFFDELKQLLPGDLSPTERLKKENLVTHTLLGEMGTKMKVLILHRNMPKPELTGMKQVAG
jgi:SAM-dependent MidA family methyltransferase